MFIDFQNESDTIFNVKDKIQNKDVTEAIQKVAVAYDFKIVEGVLNHQLKQFVIGGNKVSLPDFRHTCCCTTNTDTTGKSGETNRSPIKPSSGNSCHSSIPEMIPRLIVGWHLPTMKSS
ncbi:ERBB-3 BINDING PROTEIN 1 [Nymphaea thermarum]|nr:ERBB-3 BINDING PROTEIN 1 [Nymphaea thermarum]